MMIVLTRGHRIYLTCNVGRGSFEQSTCIMAHFYLTLPSNSSSRYYPDNTIVHYTTRLEKAISLEGEWEVALVEVQYQHSWNYIEGAEGRVLCNHTFQSGGQTKHVQDIVQLTPGYYESAADIIRIINKQMKDSAANFEI